MAPKPGKLLLVLLILPLCAFSEVSNIDLSENPGTFIVLAPKVVRPGLPYSLSVNILKSDDTEHTVRVEFQKLNNATLSSKVVNGVKTGVPQTISIDNLSALSQAQEDRCLIRVSALTRAGKLVFDDERILTFKKKSLSIFVQTDKAVYKPGSKVNYRVIVVTPDLKPYKDKVTVRIEDPSDNIIVQLNDQSLQSGVFTGELQLVSDPIFGDWKIKVKTVTGEEYEKTFSIEKYVLPKFEVKFIKPSYITTLSDLSIVVDAKYTYGKGVAGKAKVTLTYPYGGYDYSSIRLMPEDSQAPSTSYMKNYEIQRTVMLNNKGQANVVFTNEEMKARNFFQNRDGAVNVFATVTEDLTNIQQSGSDTVYAHQHDVKLQFTKQGDVVKPGLPYKLLISLVHQDGTPLKHSMPPNMEITVTPNYGYHDNQEEKKVITKIVKLDEKGSYTMHVMPPKNVSSVRLCAKYDPTGKNAFADSEINNCQSLETSKSPSNTFIQVAAPNKSNLEVGKTLTFFTKATEPIEALNYQVMSKGTMVLSGQLTNAQLSSGVLTINGWHKIQFTASHDMAPNSRLIVYAIRSSNKEVLVDAMDFKVEGMFQNKVAIKTDKTSLQPADSVKFIITADPNSYIGLLAVDQSVLLLKSGNDITQELVERDIKSYDSTYQNNWYDYRMKRSSRYYHRWSNIDDKDAESIFLNSGLFVITDCLLYEYPQSSNTNGAAASFASAGGGRMMAMAGAPGAAGGGGYSPAPIKTRSLFPETWIWTHLSNKTGEATYEAIVPDTITSWITSAFAMNENSGLGIAPTTAKIEVFRPFFIRLNLPYSVKKGEKFALQVLIFNYMDTEQYTTVTLNSDDNSGFDIIEKDGSAYKTDKTAKAVNVRFVSVPGGGGSKAVYFPIVLREIGQIKLHVQARTDTAGDAVEEFLKVESSGYRVDRNLPMALDPSKPILNLGESLTADKNTVTAKLEFPADVVQGSKMAHVDVVGDLMGPVLSNIDNLIRMPHGCGEQNMINFVPNIVVMTYLNVTKNITPDLKANLVKNIEYGYQNELSYKLNDNSFSAFGPRDPHGSTWLTAFVIRSFKQAQDLVYIDQKVLEKGIKFIESQQQENGAFSELGEVHYKAMQGGAAEGGFALTAYILATLLENNVKNRKALDYLESHLVDVKEKPYALALAAYVLHLADSPKKQTALSMLEQLQIQDNNGVHWSDHPQSIKLKSGTWRYFYQPAPADVETSAYALLTYMLLGEVNKALPLVRWLTSQRNSRGGFSSTQDTIVALQALAAYAEKVYEKNLNVQLKIINGKDLHSFSITNDNSITLQSYELTNLDAPIKLEVTGKGVAFVQIKYSYHREALRDDVPFYCSQNVKEVRGGNRVQMDLCCNYTKVGHRSNMAVAEIDAISGFKFDNEESNKLTNIKDLQRVELEKGDTRLNLYYNPLGEKPVCLSLYSDMVFHVSDQKPAQFALFDYYDPEVQIKSTYSSRQKRSLAESCPECWPTDSELNDINIS